VTRESDVVPSQFRLGWIALGRADVYFNRHKRLWSVRVQGRVVAHLDALALAHCTMRVSEAGRLRCIASGQRGVHAWITGTLVHVPDELLLVEEFGYNPFKAPNFMRRRDTTPVHTAELVIFSSAGRCFVCRSWPDAHQLELDASHRLGARGAAPEGGACP